MSAMPLKTSQGRINRASASVAKTADSESAPVGATRILATIYRKEKSTYRVTAVSA